MNPVNQELQNFIEQHLDLPSPPAIAAKILQAVQQEDAALRELARIISADPALTGKMLRIANSGLYALRSPVSSIERAISVLGTNQVKNIALSFVIATDLRQETGEEAFFERFWRRSVTCAVAAELLSKELAAADEDIFVTALLHNIGMLVLLQNDRSRYHLLLQEYDISHADLVKAEQRLYRFDHQQVGCTLLKTWSLPEPIIQPIAFHHTPLRTPGDKRMTTRILHIADQFSAVYCSPESAVQARHIQEQLCEEFQLPEERTRDLLDSVAARSIEILETFEIEPGDLKPYSQMLQEANSELGRLNLSYEQLVIELKEARDKSERLARQLSEANLRLNDLVYTDALTGLYNHRYFQEALATELARGRRHHFPVSLILFDLDHFKRINDTYGHPSGDQLLRFLADNIRKTVRPSDIVARYGGEEFAVILPQTDMTGVRVFAARLRRLVESLCLQIEEQMLQVTISVGGATCDPEQTDLTKDVLIKTADQGLYTSKRNGRNQVTILTTENAPEPEMEMRRCKPRPLTAS